MLGLNFLFALFSGLIYGIIVLYYLSAKRERKGMEFPESKIIIWGGLGYLVMLFYHVPEDSHKDELLYLFLLISLFVSLKLILAIMKDHDLFPPRIHLGVMIFMSLWVGIGINRDYRFLTIIMPVVLLQSILFFFIGLIYLLREEYEISMRNISGILFICLTAIKMFYLFKYIRRHVEQISNIFTLDVFMYLLICFVIVAFEFNQRCALNSEKNRKLIKNIQSMPIGIMELSIKGDIISMNDVVESRFQKEGIDTKGKYINIHELSRIPIKEKWDEILNILSAKETYSLEADYFTGGLDDKYEFVLMPIYDSHDNEEYLSTVSCFVINSNRHHSLIKPMEVPGNFIKAIPNKFRMMELFEEGLNQQNLREFGVVVIKIVNYDSITHIVNSHEILTIDQLIVNKLSKLKLTYCVGKVSQNTFEIITENIEVDGEIHEFIQLIKDVLSHQSFYDNDMNVYNLDYRIGISMAPEDGMTQRELLKNGMIALTKARPEEKGYVQFYNVHIKDEVVSKMQLETKLRDGILDDQLYLTFQPQFRVKDDSIRGFEALVRWKLPDQRVMMPDEFIPIAEELDIVDDLGEWVLKAAINEGIQWNMVNDMNWTVSVNVSVGQLEQDGFSESVINILKETGYPPKLLELEVTETKMVKSSDRVYVELNKLHDYGVKIAIDDFGTGYASLDYLSALPFDVLKIDKGFIDRINDNQTDHKIIESIIELVNSIGLESIAEGVETNEQLDFLKNTKCNFIQGFIYSKPMTKDAVMDLVEETEEIL